MTREELIKHIYVQQNKTDDFVSLGKYPSDNTKVLIKNLEHLKKDGYVDFNLPYPGFFMTKRTGYIDGSEDIENIGIPADEGDILAKLTLSGIAYYRENLSPKKRKLNPGWLIAIFSLISLIILIYATFFMK